MIQLIVFIIFIVSLSGILYILYKKIPTLVVLPQNGHHGFKKPALVAKIEKNFKEHYTHLFKKQMLLHTLLSKFKVWVLKIEKKIDTSLHGIRKNAQKINREKKGKSK